MGAFPALVLGAATHAEGDDREELEPGGVVTEVHSWDFDDGPQGWSRPATGACVGVAAVYCRPSIYQGWQHARTGVGATGAWQALARIEDGGPQNDALHSPMVEHRGVQARVTVSFDHRWSPRASQEGRRLEVELMHSGVGQPIWGLGGGSHAGVHVLTLVPTTADWETATATVDLGEELPSFTVSFITHYDRDPGCAVTYVSTVGSPCELGLDIDNVRVVVESAAPAIEDEGDW